MVFLALVSLALAVSIPPTNLSDAADRGPTAERPHQKLSLSEAVSIALRRNLRLTHARLEVQKNEHRRRSAYSDFFPTVDVEYTANADRYRQETVYDFAEAHDSRWVFRGEPPPEGTGFLPDYPYRIDPYRTFTLQGTLTQPIYSGGKLVNNYKYARLGVDLSRIQLDLQKQDLILAVHEAYYRFMLAKKLLQVANDSIRVLKDLRHQSRRLLQAHLALKVDVLAIETQLSGTEITRLEARTSIEKYRAMLNFLLRYPQTTPIDVISDLTFTPSRYGVPNVYSVAASNRLEIKEADISAKQALAVVKSSTAGLLPSVDLQLEGSRTNDDWNPMDPEGVNDWSIQGVLTWSFDMFRSRETVEENRTSRAQALVAREQLVEEIMKEVRDAYLELKRSEKAVAINRRTVQVSRENFRAIKELYDGQVATYLETLSAESQMSEARQAFYTSLAAHKINTAVLERKMGILR